jgi:hypothetical protein
MDPKLSTALAQNAGEIIGQTQSSKETEPFLKQYGLGLLGSLFFPQFAQAYASYKPQEFQQLFGQPGQKLSKSKGKVANTPMAGGGGFDEDPNSPLGINGSIGQYRRFVSQYNPFAYLASNPFGRPGGPSQDEQNLLNSSYFGLVPKIDLSKATDTNNGLGGIFTGLTPQAFQGAVQSMIGSLPRSNAVAPQAPLSALTGFLPSGGSYPQTASIPLLASLRGLFGNGF